MGIETLMLVFVILNVVITSTIVDIKKSPDNKQNNLVFSFILLVVLVCALAFSNFKLLEVISANGIQLTDKPQRGSIILKGESK